MFIRGETLSAHSARPKKIPGWIVLVRENFSALHNQKQSYLANVRCELHLNDICDRLRESNLQGIAFSILIIVRNKPTKATNKNVREMAGGN